jgi:TAT-translocated FGD2 family F420-dependent dehydrogenase
MLSSTPQIYYVLASEQFPVTELVKLGELAERANFDGVWTSDHFQPWQANEGHSAAAWVTLSALTQRTSRIKFGTGVTCPTFRYRPAIVAQVWANLSLLSPGRVFLGLGAGEKLNEAAAGGGWAMYEERADRLIESIDVMRKLWSGDEVDLKGKFWEVKGKLYDPPSETIPIYIAAGGPKSARLAGKYGDGLVMGASTLRKQPEIKAEWEKGVREAGKNPESMPIVVEHWAIVGTEKDARIPAQKWQFIPKAWEHGYFDTVSPVEIEKRASKEIPLEKVYADWTVSTEPRHHEEAIRELARLGATHVVVHVATENQKEVIDFFGGRVIPRISGR